MKNNNYSWKILRILTTNVCNYKCVYCHNEGQIKAKKETITIENFIRFYNIAEQIGIQEIRFSGGEPLLNIDTINMIEWLNYNSNVEIGLATNGSFVNKNIATRLGKTRVMVTLHFPGVGEENYYTVTNKKNWHLFEECVALFDKYRVNYSFNYTLYHNTIEFLEDVINYSIKKGIKIKLLPFLDSKFSNYSSQNIDDVKQKLFSKNCNYQYFDNEGVHIWSFLNGGVVKMIDSPCYDKNIKLCKEYGEIRLLPDLSLMNCIFGKKVQTKDLSDQEIQNLFISLFNEMSSCEQVIKWIR